MRRPRASHCSLLHTCKSLTKCLRPASPLSVLAYSIFLLAMKALRAPDSQLSQPPEQGWRLRLNTCTHNRPANPLYRQVSEQPLQCSRALRRRLRNPCVEILVSLPSRTSLKPTRRHTFHIEGKWGLGCRGNR